MFNLNLDHDEAVVLESDYVFRLGQDDDSMDIDYLVLTNKKLYCSYEKDNGLFKKTTTEICSWSLSDIKIINGQAQVQQVKFEGDLCLRIQFLHGIEYFTFGKTSKKIIPQWISAINNILDATAILPTTERSKRAGLFAGVVTNIESKFRASDMDEPRPSLQSQQSESVTSTQVHFCVNCGTKLSLDMNFCPECGFKVASNLEYE